MITARRCVTVLLAGLALLAGAPLSLAHPGRGIVAGERGVLVSDAVRSVVWRIDHAGRVSPLARDVHAHWLSQADDGSVLADHVVYDASTGGFLRGLKKIDPAGNVETIVPERPDPDGLNAGAFTALPAGHALVRDSDGALVIHGSGRPRSIDLAGLGGDDPVNALADLPDGSFLAVRGRALLRIDPQGVPSLIASVPPADEKDAQGGAPPIDVLWGLAVDEQGRAFIADPGGRRIVRVDADGSFTVIAHTQAPWFPTGVARHDGRLYVLEHGLDVGGNLGPRVVIHEDQSAPRVLATVTD